MNFNSLDFAHRRRSTLLKLEPRKVLQVYVVGLGSTRVKYARPSFYIQSHPKTIVLAYFEPKKCTLKPKTDTFFIVMLINFLVRTQESTEIQILFCFLAMKATEKITTKVEYFR